MRKTKYTKEFLQPIVEKSYSLAEVLRTIGIGVNGGNHRSIKGYIKTYDISTAHFTGTDWATGRTALTDSRIRVATDIFIKGVSRNANTLRRHMLLTGIQHKCSNCGLEAFWNNQPLTLHIDHINGDSTDNTIENIRFLCPNCHQQTLTWGNPHRKKNDLKCSDCQMSLSRRSRSGYCKSCRDKHKVPKVLTSEARMKYRKVKNRPSIDELKKLILETNYEAVGRKYGVSGNAIRKWLI